MSRIVRQFALLGPATIRARLYDLGPYPGIVIDASPLIVRGQLVRLADARHWDELDRYEGCPLPDCESGLFRRNRTTARRETGESAECWVYVYDRPVAGRQLVESGCWLTHRRQSKM